MLIAHKHQATGQTRFSPVLTTALSTTKSFVTKCFQHWWDSCKNIISPSISVPLLLWWSLWMCFCPLLARGQVFQKLVACINYRAHILHLIAMLSFASIRFFANVLFSSHFCASPRRSYQTSMLKIYPQTSLMHIWLMKAYSLHKLQFGMPPPSNS